MCVCVASSACISCVASSACISCLLSLSLSLLLVLWRNPNRTKKQRGVQKTKGTKKEKKKIFSFFFPRAFWVLLLSSVFPCVLGEIPKICILYHGKFLTLVFKSSQWMFPCFTCTHNETKKNTCFALVLTTNKEVFAWAPMVLHMWSVHTPRLLFLSRREEGGHIFAIKKKNSGPDTKTHTQRVCADTRAKKQTCRAKRSGDSAASSHKKGETKLAAVRQSRSGSS